MSEGLPLKTYNELASIPGVALSMAPPDPLWHKQERASYVLELVRDALCRNEIEIARAWGARSARAEPTYGHRAPAVETGVQLDILGEG